MGKNVSLGRDKFSAAIEKSLYQYSSAVRKDMATLAKYTARKAVLELEETSPKNENEYANSWVSTVEKEDGTVIKVTVHNKLYQLTHLLENGHQLWQGGFSPAYVHIKPVEQMVNEEFKEGCEDIIKNNGY